MGLLNETFGVSGTAQSYFGGEWWLVGLLLILILMIYFFSKGISAEGLSLFLFAAIMLITVDGLFTIADNIIMTVVIFILIFWSFAMFKLISK